MSSYDALAGAYDDLMADASYCKRADYLERQFRKGQIPVHTVLDLACGTGTIACLLAERGYQVIATDGSEDMLTQAMRKAENLSAPPLFLHQPMPRLRLLEQVDAVVSTLDSLNYLTSVKDLRDTFQRVYRWLKPGGEFFFDVNSPYKLRNMDGGLWIDEKPDICCVWRTEFSQRTQICTYWVDLFRLRADGAWDRDFEEHREKAWEVDALRGYLAEAGFSKVTVSGDLKSTPPKPDEDRLIFRCEKR